MENVILLKDQTLLIVLSLLFFIVGFLVAKHRYKGKMLSFPEFFKEGKLFVLENIICDGEQHQSVFAFRRVRHIIIFKKITFGRLYHVSGSQGFCFIDGKQKYTFEKGIVYKVKEVWRDPGNVNWAPWHFHFEIPEPLPSFKNVSLSFNS